LPDCSRIRIRREQLLELLLVLLQLLDQRLQHLRLLELKLDQILDLAVGEIQNCLQIGRLGR